MKHTKTFAIEEFSDQCWGLWLGYPSRRPPLRRGRCLPPNEITSEESKRKLLLDTTARFSGLGMLR